MTKTEFLAGLQRALTGKLESSEVQRHVAYYQEYIEVQVRKGKTEEQVVEELGTPALIAKSILTAAKDGESFLNETTLYSVFTRLKSVCLQTAKETGRKLGEWFDQLK